MDLDADTPSRLAQLLDENGEVPDLLSEIAEAGVYVPVNRSNSVIFTRTSDGGPTVPGFVSEECCRAKLPEAAAVFHCSALQLLDISTQTGIDTLTVSSWRTWVKVPLVLLAQVLEQHGQLTRREQAVTLTRSALPLASALRDALSHRLQDFPSVGAVWIADARWHETGEENLLLHVGVNSADIQPVHVRHLLEPLISKLRTATDPPVVVRTLPPDQQMEIDALGLETVRANDGDRIGLDERDISRAERVRDLSAQRTNDAQPQGHPRDSAPRHPPQSPPASGLSPS